jgi:hypothetical protein
MAYWASWLWIGPLSSVERTCLVPGAPLLIRSFAPEADLPAGDPVLAPSNART